MARHLYNPKQTQETRTYVDSNGYAVVVDKTGYVFSDDKAMDSVVNFFKKEYGFVEVKKGKK